MEMLIDHKLESLAFTTRKKVNLDDRDPLTFRWLEEGWIIKEVRFEKDEKTVRTSHYRMGFHLYQYEQLKIQQRVAQTNILRHHPIDVWRFYNQRACMKIALKHCSPLIGSRSLGRACCCFDIPNGLFPNNRNPHFPKYQTIFLPHLNRCIGPADIGKILYFW